MRSLLPGLVTAASFTVIDVPAGVPAITSAMAISADGSTVVGTDNYPAPGGDAFRPLSKAFVWDAEHGMRALDVILASLGIELAGWELFEARSVSADGRTILGRGLDPNGRAQTFVAAIPEPGAGLLLDLGLALLSRAAEGGRRRAR